MLLKKSNTDIKNNIEFFFSNSKSIRIKNCPTYTPCLKLSTNDSTTVKENNSLISIKDIEFEENFFKEKKNLFKTLSNNSLTDNSISIIKKWYVLLNVTFALIRMRNIKIQRISTEMIDKLTFEKSGMKSTRQKKENKVEKSSSMNNQPLDYITEQIKLFQYIENGLDKYENEIIQILKRNNFINDFNYENQTPIYASCLNGHVKMTKILIDNGADYLKLYDKDQESILDVAVRFNYVSLVEFLLQYCKWPKSYIRRSMKYINKRKSNKAMNKLFKNMNKKEKKENGCFCGCFGL